jgi:glycosyltransferase involved in cell wall biosynthesis
MVNLHFANLVVVVSAVMKDELKSRGIEDRKILVNPNCVDAEKYFPNVDASGNTRPKSEEIAQRDGVGEFVTFTGLVPQEEGPKYLAACDILASPHIPNPDGTPFFGSPTKLFEFMAMGKGIVASDLDQIGQILENRYDAILVKPGNVNDLAEGILDL